MTSATKYTIRHNDNDKKLSLESCNSTSDEKRETRNDERTEDLFEPPVNMEEISVLWFDRDLNSNIEDINLTRNLLQQINNYVLFLTSQTECLKYIERVKNEKILLILSGASTNDDEFLHQIHKFRQIDSVFIFCIGNQQHGPVLPVTNYSKIIGAFTDQEALVTSMRQTIKLIEEQSLVYALYNHAQKSTRNLTNELGSFIWHQLLKDVLEKMSTDTTDGKREMLDVCYTYYRDNKKELENIQRFEQTYTADEAIQWYTKDCFIFRLINKALRTEDIDVLYTFRYYINGLSSCLKRNYELAKPYQTKTLKLYRGIKQTNEEIQRLQKSIGNLISTNGFFSTTSNRAVAELFAGVGCDTDKFQSLLFEISINTQTHKNCIFADVSRYSQFADEQEVLFDLGTVFEITSVNYDPLNKYWLCKMTSTNQGLHIADEYLTLRKKEITNKNIDLIILFGELLYDMGEYDKSQKYFENLLSSRGNDVNVYVGIAHAQYIKCQYQEAIKNYKHAYDICDPSDFLLTARILKYLAYLYKFDGQYEICLKYSSDALDILKQNEPGDQSNRLLADILELSSQVYSFFGNALKSLEYAENALDIIEKLVPCPHLDLVEALTSAALAYRKAGYYDKSLERQTKALEIIKQVLPDSHQYLGVALNNIGKAYYKKCDYQKAIEYLKQCMEVYANVWPNYHQRRAIPLNHLGKTYFRIKDYDQALNYYSQAMDMLEKTVSLKHTDIAYTLKNIGEVYLDLLDFDKALVHFHQALDIYKEKFGTDKPQPDIAKCYHLIGQVYLKQHDANRALEYFHSTWNTWQTTLVSNHPDLALCTENIARAYLLKAEYRTAIEYLLKTLDVYGTRLPFNDLKIIGLRHLIMDTEQKMKETL